MASFNVTITTNTTPAIVIQLSGTTTYAQLKNSLGQYVYFLNKLYLFSTLLKQIQSTLNYSKYDSSGNQNLQSIISAVDPYQGSSSIYLNTKEKNIIIDGRNTIRFNMQPNTTLQGVFFVYCISNGDAYDMRGLNTFLMVQDELSDPDFFDDYIDLL